MHSACDHCVRDTKILKGLSREIQGLRDDVKHLLHLNSLHDNNVNFDENCCNFVTFEALEEFDKTLKDEEQFKKCVMK